MEIFIRGLAALGIALAVAALGFARDPMPVGPVAAYQHGCNDCGSGCGSKGLLGGRLGKLFGSGCNNCAPPAKPPAPPLRTQPGTVVFPQHPFVRSPRDFFMVD